MIEIDEEGAEAAATTAVMSSRALGADDAIHGVVEKGLMDRWGSRRSEMTAQRPTGEGFRITAGTTTVLSLESASD
jgi:hypothetical protein